MSERKYELSLSFLVDLLTINQLKEVMIPEKRSEVSTDISNLMADIEKMLPEGISADFVRDIIVLAQYNTHIWYNEKNIREGIKEGNQLELTHGLNNIRNVAKNRIEDFIGGRKEHKKDNVKPFPEWVPSGY